MGVEVFGNSKSFQISLNICNVSLFLKSNFQDILASQGVIQKDLFFLFFSLKNLRYLTMYSSSVPVSSSWCQYRDGWRVTKKILRVVPLTYDKPY